jgi:dipeptidyl aminopeptidase/acylaminoacyl peptidase
MSPAGWGPKKWSRRQIVSDPEHSAVMYRALKRAGVSAELHVYADSTHDFGVRKVNRPCDEWTKACAAWLKHRGLIK